MRSLASFSFSSKNITSWVDTCVTRPYLLFEVSPVLEDALFRALQTLRSLELFEGVACDLDRAFPHVVSFSVAASSHFDVVVRFAFEARQDFEEESVHGEARREEAWVSSGYLAPA